jgi:ribonuclease HI
MNEYLAWFDGACEPVNPGGKATFGVVVKARDGTVLLREHGYVGEGSQMSNNVAECAGVLHVLKYLAPRPPGRVTIHGDSNLVINQLNGKWRIRKGLYRSIAMEAKELLAYLRGLGWKITCCWIPRTQNEECDALSKKIGHTALKPSPPQRKVRKGQDPRDALMIGRTIKSTRITVLRADPSRGADWWICRCSCGREFVAHGWNVRHGRTRHCGYPHHEVQPQDHSVAAITMPAPSACLQASHASEPGRQVMADSSSDIP